MGTYEKIKCKVCGGSYYNYPSHKRIHIGSNKHVLATIKLKQLEEKYRELREIFEY